MKIIVSMALFALISTLCHAADADLVVGDKVRVKTTPYQSYPGPRTAMEDKKALELLPKMSCQTSVRLKVLDFASGSRAKSRADSLRKSSSKAVSKDVKLAKIYFDFELDFRPSTVIERRDFRYFQGLVSRQKKPLDLEDRKKEVPLKINEALHTLTFKIVTEDGHLYKVPMPMTYEWEDETKTQICRTLDEAAALKVLEKFTDKHSEWMDDVTKIDLKKEKRDVKRKEHPSYEDFSDFETPAEKTDIQVKSM
jgi:translation initiation factor IF-1